MDLSTLGAAPQQSTSAATSATAQLTQNFDTFLTLLTAQLRNQDPLEPLNTESFTEQLVQFASVEQSIQTNQNLEALIALQSASASERALAMVGRIASVEADIAALTPDGARWNYTLPRDAADISVQIFDERGALVAELDGPTSAGAHEILWDGRTIDGSIAPPGAYRLQIEAAGDDDTPITPAIFSRGVVDAVVFDAGVPQIEIAGQRFALDLVTRIDVNF